ncbi:MAG: hypothetical protein IH613_01830 [Desulfuromonadales bacterium]|nr:hypothetical protein [Desulfuromonadales bacterium]
MKTGIVLIAVLALFPLAGQGWAENMKIRPGLWEHTLTMKTQGGEMENAMADGKHERMEMTQAGKWLSDDCGNVKPPRR